MASARTLSSISSEKPNVQPYQIKTKSTDDQVVWLRLYAFANKVSWDPENHYHHPNGPCGITGSDWQHHHDPSTIQDEYLARNAATPLQFRDGLDHLRERYSRKGLFELLKWSKDPITSNKVPEVFKKYCMTCPRSQETNTNPELWSNTHYFQSQFQLPNRTHTTYWTTPKWDSEKVGCTLQEQYFVEKAFLVFSRAIEILSICAKEYEAQIVNGKPEDPKKLKLRFSSINCQTTAHESYHLDLARIIAELVQPIAAKEKFSIEVKNKTSFLTERNFLGTLVEIELKPRVISFLTNFSSTKVPSKKEIESDYAEFNRLLIECKTSTEIQRVIALAKKHPEFLTQKITEGYYKGLFPINVAISRANTLWIKEFIGLNSTILYMIGSSQNKKNNCEAFQYLLNRHKRYDAKKFYEINHLFFSTNPLIINNLNTSSIYYAAMIKNECESLKKMFKTVKKSTSEISEPPKASCSSLSTTIPTSSIHAQLDILRERYTSQLQKVTPNKTNPSTNMPESALLNREIICSEL